MTIDHDALAARMFGATTPTSQPTLESMPADTSLAERLFGASTPKPAAQTNQWGKRDERPVSELTEDEQAQRLFGGTDPTLTHADATQAIINAGLEDHLHDPETAGEIAAEWASTFASHQLSGTDSKELADIGAQVMREPPTVQLVEQWTETAIADLKATYGVQGAGQALQDARSYIEMRGDLKTMLDSLGLGSHPKIVALAAAKGRALRLSGKIR